jgi:GNAT superfamily N-acetyltransferase
MIDLVQSDRLSEEQVLQLHALYQGEWWTRGRELDDVRRMLAGSDLIVALCEPETGRLAAFGRVLTDGVYKAFLFDVIVAPEYRSRGLGRGLMDAVCEHPAVRDVRHLELYCLPELVPFYAQWGFTPASNIQLLRRQTGR